MNKKADVPGWAGQVSIHHRRRTQEAASQGLREKQPLRRVSTPGHRAYASGSSDTVPGSQRSWQRKNDRAGTASLTKKDPGCVPVFCCCGKANLKTRRVIVGQSFRIQQGFMIPWIWPCEKVQHLWQRGLVEQNIMVASRQRSREKMGLRTRYTIQSHPSSDPSPPARPHLQRDQSIQTLQWVTQWVRTFLGGRTASTV